MKQLYTIRFDIDYRGMGIDYEKVEPDWFEIMKEEDLRFEVNLEHPATGYKVYWGCEFPNYAVEIGWSFEREDDARNHMLKIYSQINDRLPFVVTGNNSAYKEQGFYPEISETIKCMKTIKLPYELNYEHHYFMILLDFEDILEILPLEYG